jgi:transitional endoplasmic reticulum ATPase
MDREERWKQQQLGLWSLRILSKPEVLKTFLSYYLDEESVMTLAGLKDHVLSAMPQREWRRLVREKRSKLEEALPKRSGRFIKNLEHLGDLIGLGEAEREFLLFAILLEENDDFRSIVSALGELNLPQTRSVLASILGFTKGAMESAISRESVLHTSGLVQWQSRGSSHLEDRFEVLGGLSRALFQENLEMVWPRYFYSMRESALRMEDFSHLGRDLAILRPFLDRCLTEQLPGVNVLLHGPPGTGKTELAKVLSRSLGADLFGVSNCDEDGDPATSVERLQSYRLCQRILVRNSRCLVLFDEIEDVFERPEVFWGVSMRKGKNKGWTNHILEANGVPAIWVSNEVRHIDEAFIRRFDYVMEVPVPPHPTRRRILLERTESLPVQEGWIEQMAHIEHLAPAHIEKATRVVRVSRLDKEAPQECEGSLARIMSNAHRAIGLRAAARPTHKNPFSYALEYVNVEMGLELTQLIEVLRLRGIGRICLFGPPGSGKTEFVKHVGLQLDLPVLSRRASDLLGCYVGETEQHVAAMFRQAESEGAILLLDEADSFLQSRGRAHHSWEITQVNELLVQMESFEGLFFCATNFMDALDDAVFRRFDLKARFGYLKPQQLMNLFTQTLQMEDAWRSAWDDAAVRSLERRLSALPPLTVGDFAAVRRRFQLTPTPLTPDRLLESLAGEAAFKRDVGKHRIGFGCAR